MSVTAAILGKDIGRKGRHIMYFSFFAVLLFVISVSYISIFVKVRFCHRLPNHGSSSVMDRKLTNTLFMVTLASIFTWLPLIIGRSLSSLNPQLLKNLNRRLADHLFRGVLMLYLANSLINPIIYAMRLPELRQGIMKIIFRQTPNSSNQDDSPIRNLWFISFYSVQTVRINQHMIPYVIWITGADKLTEFLARRVSWLNKKSIESHSLKV